MTDDVVIIGAGPAGAEAAITARACGLSVTVLDDSGKAGGQVYRAPRFGLAGDREMRAGDDLRRRLRDSGATLKTSHRVWLAERGFRVAALGPDGPVTFDARRLIVASGAIERHLPIPGWTLPGVIGLAGATILLKSQGVLPGRRTVVAGAGPLLPMVAAKIIEAGGEVAAVIDISRRRDWLSTTPRLLAHPGLAARGAGWLATLLKKRTPLLFGHALRRIDGTDTVARVVAGPVDRLGRPTLGAESVFEACTVAYGFGLMPATDITGLLGADHVFDAGQGGWRVATDENQATSLPGLYACGDCAGVAGAEAAPLSGRIAGLAVARDLQKIDAATFQAHARPLRAALKRSSAFGFAMAARATPGPGAVDLIASETIVCRCEGVTRATLDAAIAAGSHDLNDLKAATRCGMGPCGGRVCAEAAAMLIAAHTGLDRARIGRSTPRPPLYPVSLDELAGEFNYDDVPIPELSPL